MLAFIGGTAGSAAGWAAGAPLGVFAAYVVSMAGFGAGLYAARRLARHWDL
jgi:hypothetical protein